MQLIILGMHRSGTSVLARLLNMMGAYFGSEGISTGANKENPKGFWERRDVRQINDYVLNSVDCDWNKIAGFDVDALPQTVVTEFREKASKIVLELDSHRPWFIKEPRLCLLFKLWNELLEVPVCIHIYRNPVEVANSLYTRNGIPVHTGIALWEKYNLSALEASHGLSRFVVSHNNLMKDPVSEVKYIYEQLLSFGMDGLHLPSKKEIMAFVREDLYREKVGDEEFPQFLNANQTKISNGFTNGQLLKRRHKFNLSKASVLTLEQYEQLAQQEKDLTQQHDQQAQEAERALASAAQVEADLRQQLAQQDKDLTQQRDQQAQEAKQALESAAQVEADLKKQLAQQDKVLTQQRDQQAQEAKQALKSAAQVEADLKKQLAQQEKDLIQQRDQQAQEAKQALKSAAQVEADLKKQLAQQEKVLTQQRDQQAQEAKQALKSAAQVEADLRQQLAQQEKDLTQQRDQQAQEAKQALKSAAQVEANLKKQLAQQEKDLTQQHDQLAQEAENALASAAQVEADLRQQLTQKEKNLTQQRDQQAQEAERALASAAQVEAVLRQQLAQQVKDLTQQRDQQGQEAEQALASAAQIEADLRQQLAKQTMQLELVKKGVIGTEHYITRQDEIISQLFSGIDSLVTSRRWLFGNAVFSLRHKLFFRKVPDMATDYLNKVRERYYSLGLGQHPMHVHVLEALNNKSISVTIDGVNANVTNLDQQLNPQEKKIAISDGNKTTCDKMHGIESLTENPAVSVIIPIFNGFEDVCSCLVSVFATISQSVEVILIDDASTDSRIWPLLKTCKTSIPRIRIKSNRKNLGYTKTVNYGCRLAYNDVVLLNSDTIVTRGWLEHLRLTAYKQDNVATVTPLSNAAGAFSIPENNTINEIPLNWTVEKIAEALRNTSENINPEVPTGNGFCMYIRSSAMGKVGEFDENSFPRGYGEENDFCMRAIKSGFVNLIDDTVYVYHKRSSSFGSEKESLIMNSREMMGILHPEYKRLVRNWLDNDPLDKLRNEMGAQLAYDPKIVRGTILGAGIEAGAEEVDTSGSVLYWLHAGGGGTRLTSNDLTEKISARRSVFVVLAAKDAWTLYTITGKTWHTSNTHRFDNQWKFNNSLDAQRIDALNNILDCTQPELIHIRHFIASAPEIVDYINVRNIPIVLSFHDFYCICPTIQLLDNNTKYCGGDCLNSSTSKDCGLVKNWFSDPPRLKSTYINLWKSRMSRSFEQCDHFVSTSQAAQTVMMENYPELSERKWSVIEHGRDMHMYTSVRAAELTYPFRIAVVGALGRSKGLGLILELMKHDQRDKKLFEFHFFGNVSDIFRPEKYGGICHGEYNRDELSKVMSDVQPHCALIASVWPETYCHTLTESWAMGLPVIATDIGAVAERIRTSGGGWCFPFASSSEFYQDMARVFENDAEFERVVNEVANINIKSVNEMVDDYQDLYKQLV